MGSIRNIDSAGAGAGSSGAFSVAALDRVVTGALALARDIPLAIAYSGGRDSSVLLHAAAATGRPLRALHIDHGLHPQSDDWARHCAAVCAQLGIACVVERVTVDARGTHGLEAAARKARYAALARRLNPGEVLLTAHHQDDQAETLLLHLFRGAGVYGLAAMRPIMPFPPGRLARPLLGFARAALAGYADSEQLHWIEDTSNDDVRLRRNYLRREILPRLESTWPGVHARLAAAARHAAEAVALLDEIAAEDYMDARAAPIIQSAREARLGSPPSPASGRGNEGEGHIPPRAGEGMGMGMGAPLPRPHPFPSPKGRGEEVGENLYLGRRGKGEGNARCEQDSALSLSAVARLSIPRRVNLLRGWLRARGLQSPPESALRRMLEQVETRPRSGLALIRWGDIEVRRYRDTLIARRRVAPAARDWEQPWDTTAPLAIPGTDRRLRVQAVVGTGLARARIENRRLTVRFRRGGETCCMRGHRHALKKLLQETGIPPWERGVLPLIYVDDDLAAVGDLWVCEPYAAQFGEAGLALVVDPEPQG